jgi:SOS-response transcriptional repressor LexA
MTVAAATSPIPDSRSTGSVLTLDRFSFVVLAARWGGGRPEPIGVLAWRDGDGKLLMRRDFHLAVTDEDDLEVLVALERSLEGDLRQMGPEALVAALQDQWSNMLTVSDTEVAAGARLDQVAARLYRQHVPTRVQRYETHLPRIQLKAAAGSWSEAMTPEQTAAEAGEWVEILNDGLTLDERMFVAQVVGRSMEPEIPDGSWCIFRYQPAGSRDGRKVLVENFGDAANRYTVKRYRSIKTYTEDGAVAARRVRLEPLNPEFSPWELEEGADCRILAEFVSVAGLG